MAELTRGVFIAILTEGLDGGNLRVSFQGGYTTDIRYELAKQVPCSVTCRGFTYEQQDRPVRLRHTSLEERLKVNCEDRQDLQCDVLIHLQWRFKRKYWCRRELCRC